MSDSKGNNGIQLQPSGGSAMSTIAEILKNNGISIDTGFSKINQVVVDFKQRNPAVFADFQQRITAAILNKDGDINQVIADFKQRNPEVLADFQQKISGAFASSSATPQAAASFPNCGSVLNAAATYYTANKDGSFTLQPYEPRAHLQERIPTFGDIVWCKSKQSRGY